MKDHVGVSYLTKFGDLMLSKCCVMDLETTSQILRKGPQNQLQNFDGVLQFWGQELFCLYHDEMQWSYNTHVPGFCVIFLALPGSEFTVVQKATSGSRCYGSILNMTFFPSTLADVIYAITRALLWKKQPANTSD